MVTTTSHDGAGGPGTDALAKPDRGIQGPDGPEVLIKEARQHQRRRRLWIVVAVLVLASALVIGLLASGGSGSAGSRPGASKGEGGRSQGGSGANRTSARPVVDLAVAPKGWVPVAYGDVQVSVPPNWDVLDAGDCDDGEPAPSDAVYLGSSQAGGPCNSSESYVWLRTASTKTPPGAAKDINGITVYSRSSSPTVFHIPSLATLVSGKGPLTERVLHTLSVSPRYVALAKGPIPSVPASWHRVTYGGLSVAVPADWPVVNDPQWHSCTSDYESYYREEVVLDSGTADIDVMKCIGFPLLDALSTIGKDGLTINTGPYRALSDHFWPPGNCIPVNSLTVCPLMFPYSIMPLDVHVQGRNQLVEVDIGLAGSGDTARTILYSIEKA